MSLIDAAAKEFLERLRQELLKPDPGLGELEIDPEDIICLAGRSLCRDTVARIDQRRIEGMHDLFNACSTISSLGYEKSVASGRMILCRRDHLSLNPRISLIKPEKLSRYRAARKLFQLASGDLSLHSDSEEVFGLVSLRDYDETQEDLFEMQVLGHQHWELNHAGKTLMKVGYGIPSLPRLSFHEAKLRSDLARIFRSINPDDTSRLVTLIRAAEEVSHGALLIISENAAAEAHRLRKRVCRSMRAYSRPTCCDVSPLSTEPFCFRLMACVTVSGQSWMEWLVRAEILAAGLALILRSVM